MEFLIRLIVNMDSIFIISVISGIISIFIPIKHWKTRYFNYFLVFAFMSTFSFLIQEIFNSTFMNYFLIAGDFYSFIFLTQFTQTKKHHFIVLGVCFAVVLIAYVVDLRMFEIWEMLIINILSLVFIIINFLNYSIKNKKITLFYIIFVLFQTINVIKFINIISYSNIGFFYFYASTYFLIFIGIFFLFVNEDTNKFILYRFKSG